MMQTIWFSGAVYFWAHVTKKRLFDWCLPYVKAWWKQSGGHFEEISTPNREQSRQFGLTSNRLSWERWDGGKLSFTFILFLWNTRAPSWCLVTLLSSPVLPARPSISFNTPLSLKGNVFTVQFNKKHAEFKQFAWEGEVQFYAWHCK